MNKTIELSKGWLLAIDPENTGKESGMALALPETARPAPVPGIIQQVYTSYHGVAWYYRTVTEDELFPLPDHARRILQFGAVDYFSECFLDGVRIGEHEGAEDPFSFDVTELLKPGSLLAVRVINPIKGVWIDGFEMETTPHRNKADGAFRPGSCYNSGGITLPVSLQIRSELRIEDCFVRSDWKSGRVSLLITLKNELTEKTDLILTASVRPADSPLRAAEYTAVVTAEAGESQSTMEFVIPEHKLWDIDHPDLYELTLTAESALTDAEPYSVTFGFRDFRLVNGFFHLNGRRIFLKSAHTGNHMPEGLALPAPSMPEMEYKDFQLSKAAGYNCIRFIATQATPRQLDYCDRLGLMVYQETYASWLLGNSDQARRRFDESILAEVKRDRNHPCLTMWGMLNETVLSDAHYAAIDCLPKLRALDDTRLVLLSSGRFDLHHSLHASLPDYRPDLSIGSAANPGSSVWENVWGNDGIDYDEIPKEEKDYFASVPYNAGLKLYVGDLHAYPGYPHNPATIEFLRTFGHSTKPVFISEYGIGSHLNVIEHCAEFKRRGTDPTAADYLLMASIRDRYLKDFYRFGFDTTYADPDDHLRDSERYNAITRRAGFDIVRANPRFVGFNMTGLLDHAICGEGPYTLFRQVKPLNFDALQEGWAPLRWCLFFYADGAINNGCHVYQGTPLTLEAVLADEDQLADAEHTAVFAIVDENGTPVHRAEVTFTPPAPDENGMRPFAYPVYRETVTLDAAPGKYHFRAFLKDGGSPAAWDREFYLSARPASKTEKKVALIGIADSVAASLTSLGITLTDPASADLILAGKVSDEEGRELIALAEQGKRVVFADPEALVTAPDQPGYSTFLPLPHYAAQREWIWLYHPEGAVKADRFTKGMKVGFLDWTWYYDMCPAVGFTTSREPDSVTAAHFSIGGPGEYRASLILATFRQGQGELILSTFPMLSALTKAPAADLLLFNLLEG